MPLAPIQQGDIEGFDKVIAINLRGTFLVTFLVMSEAAIHLSDGGRVIAFSSSVLAKSFPSYGPYIASKAGVEGLVRVLANELRGRNITVNAVAPGPVATELFLKGKSEEQLAGMAKMAPLERIGQVDDIAGVVSFLAGPGRRLREWPGAACERRLRVIRQRHRPSSACELADRKRHVSSTAIAIWHSYSHLAQL